MDDHAEDANPRATRTVGEWLAIVGSVLAAVSVGLIAAILLSLAASLQGGSSPISHNSPGVLLAILLASVYLAIGYGFVRRSRIAYGVGLLLHGWTLAGFTSMLVIEPRLGATLIPYLVIFPALLVVAGLLLGWRSFWRRSR